MTCCGRAQTAAWVSVDDTGARHAGKNGFCTQIGNDDFAWFATRTNKSRLNFLDLLRAGHTDYVINQAALDYMPDAPWQEPSFISWPRTAGAVRRSGRLAEHMLDRLDMHDSAGRCRIRFCIATEGALWGSVQAHGLLREMVDCERRRGASSQLASTRSAGDVHAERLVHKLDSFTDLHRTAQQRMRALIWQFYDDLEAYRAKPAARRRDATACPLQSHLPSAAHRLRHARSPARASCT